MNSPQGINMDASLALDEPGNLLSSNCTTVDDCALTLFYASRGWIQVFLRHQHEDPGAGLRFTRDQVEAAYGQSVAEFGAVMGTADPDLARLGASGAKMLVWHGLADALIPPGGSTDYYERVAAETTDAEADVDDFYRLFLAPGVGHCGGGPGLDPSPEVFFQLVRWVEDGTAPETLAASGPAVGPGNVSAARRIGLCRYPSVLTFTGADPNDEASFQCL